MRWVVTGAAGFIGSHLSEALLAAGHDVVGVDAFTDYYDVALKEENARGLDVRRLDLAVDDLELDGVDGVFHLGGQPGVRSFGDVFDVYARNNLVASRRVFEAAARAGVRVVFASSSSIYGDAERYPTAEDVEPRPISPYGITKLGCEHLARAYAQGFGLDVVVLRFFTFYGPRQRPDMAFARIVDVGGGSEVTMRDAIATLEDVSGRSLDLVERPAAKGDVRRTTPDTARVERDLGWRATTSLPGGLKAQWDWAANRVAAR